MLMSIQLLLSKHNCDAHSIKPMIKLAIFKHLKICLQMHVETMPKHTWVRLKTSICAQAGLFKNIVKTTKTYLNHTTK